MSKKTVKSVSFNAMVKFFMQSYGVPTKKDVNKLHERLDRIEQLIKSSYGIKRRINTDSRKKTAAGNSAVTASDVVANVINQSDSDGVDFAGLKDRTGFEEKKLRNIIFRLNKNGRITRKSRGVYILPEKEG
ncbi:MAG: hypothetical protein J7K32_04675 [Deltaproteobacteria bacterium]|nr:hypothetical protein [Deltaproteobacteria bacterium]